MFPLLCPVREEEWIPGWKAEIVHSESGFAELDCVFVTELFDGRDVWSVSRYEPDQHRIEFVIVGARHVQRLAVEACDTDTGCELTWTRTYTSLTAEGDAVVERLAAQGKQHGAVLAGLLAQRLEKNAA